MSADQENALQTALEQEIATYLNWDLRPEHSRADHNLAIYAAGLIAIITLRADESAAVLRIEEGSEPDERTPVAVVSAEGTERHVTNAEYDALANLTANLCDSNTAAWHPLCSHVDNRHGVYHLDLTKARQAGLDLLARNATPAK